MSQLFERMDDAQRRIVEGHLKTIPVKLGALARDLNAEVRVAAMGPGQSGSIQWDGNRYIIRVNRHDTRERQRFTIAHEIAHLLLHSEKIRATEGGIQDNILYRSGEPEAIEYEANRLAADIVMPRQEIERYRNNLSPYGDAQDLAERFGVSRSAMEIRLGSR